MTAPRIRDRAGRRLRRSGLYRLPEAAYHRDPCATPSLSSTVARTLLAQSPAHARWRSENPEEKRVFDVGRAAHREVLGQGADYAVVPERLLASNGAASTKAAKEWISDTRARGVTPIREEEAEAIARMADAVRAHLELCGISPFDPRRSEVCAIAEVEGVLCRALIDHAPADPAAPLTDFKTTMDATPEAAIRAICRYGYDVQAAHYLATWRAATSERRGFRFVFVEKEPPHGCSVLELHDDPESDADWMLDAHHKASVARRLWARCLATGAWPAYPPGVAVVGAPGWHRAAWADRALPPDLVQQEDYP